MMEEFLFVGDLYSTKTSISGWRAGKRFSFPEQTCLMLYASVGYHHVNLSNNLIMQILMAINLNIEYAFKIPLHCEPTGRE